MKAKKIVAAVLAAAMMITSIQLPPVQVSAEENAPTDLHFVAKIDDRDERITWTNFTHTNVDKPNNYDRTETGAGNSGATAEFYFYGDSVKVIGTKHSNGGTFKLSIDDEVKAENVETYANPEVYQQVLVKVDGLDLGIHKVKLETKEDKWVSLDAFEFTASEAIDSEILRNNAWSNSEQLPEAGSNKDGGAKWAFDDDDRWWHSRYQNWDQKAEHEVGTQKTDGHPSDINPIWIQTGFDEPYYITSINYQSRTNANNRIKDCTISVANSAKSKEELTDADFKVIYTGTFGDTTGEQTIKLGDAYLATHVRITVTSTWAGGHVTAKKIAVNGYKQNAEVEKKELLSAMDEAKDLIDDAYVAGALDQVNATLEAAVAVYEKDEANQQEVDEAKNTLLAALITLKTEKREFNPTILATNAKANSEQREADGDDGPVEWAFDDEPHWWHSRWKGTPLEGEVSSGLVTENPIWIQTGFGTKWYVDSIDYKARENLQGTIKKYTVSVANLENPNATPTENDFEKVEVTSGDFVNTTNVQTITLKNPVEATHVRITVTEVHTGNNGTAHVNAENISIFGYDSLGKIALKSAIDDANEIKAEVEAAEENKYYVDLYQDVMDALNVANTLHEEEYAVVSELDAATAALRTALDNLKEKTELRVFPSEILIKNAGANSEQLPAAQYSPQDGPAIWAFDNEDRWWHSRYEGTKGDHELSSGSPSEKNKIWIQTGFDKKWYVDSMVVTSRNQTNIKEFEILVANLANPKDEPKDSDFNKLEIAQTTLANSTDPQKIDLGKVVEATHIRLVAKNVYGNNNYVAVKNITIMGYDKLSELEVKRNALYDAIAEADDLYAVFAEDNEDNVYTVDEAHKKYFKAVKDAANAGRDEIETVSSVEDIQKAINEIYTANEALRDIYLDASEADWAGASATLKGKIDLNFYMKLGDADNLIKKGAYMNFSVDGKDDVPVFVREALKKTTEDETEYYVFSYSVPVKDMGTEITAQMILPENETDAEQKGLLYTYSVQKYLDEVSLNSGNYEETVEKAEQLKVLVEEMKEFGNLAYQYFDTAAEGMEVDVPEETLEALEAATVDRKIPTEKIYYGSSLLLESNTTLRHYFTEEVRVVSVTVGDESVDVTGYELVEKGKLYHIQHTGIPAHQLGDYITMTVRSVKSGEEITIVYSPLTYANIALNRTNADGTRKVDKLTSLMLTMYDYQQAAWNYQQPL